MQWFPFLTREELGCNKPENLLTLSLFIIHWDIICHSGIRNKFKKFNFDHLAYTHSFQFNMCTLHTVIKGIVYGNIDIYENSEIAMI